MKELLEAVRTASFDEYRRASEKFGKANNSPHESYAVILEEYEEALEQSECFAKLFGGGFWTAVRANADAVELNTALELMYGYALNAAAEWCQVAAMCYKAQQTNEGGVKP